MSKSTARAIKRRGQELRGRGFSINAAARQLWSEFPNVRRRTIVRALAHGTKIIPKSTGHQVMAL